MKTRCILIAILAAAADFYAQTPEPLNATDWTSIRAAYEGGRHQFFPQEDGSHSARNPRLGWTMRFDATGFTATDGTWTWGLELEQDEGRGASGSLAGKDELGEPAARTTGNRIAFQRSAKIEEWFINDQRGLEQGWTLTAPAEIRLRVRGDLQPKVSAQSVTFGGQITYSGLKAWDVNGKDVAVWFEPSAGGIAVCYDDREARYPITIDPIAQNAYLKASNTGEEDGFGHSVAVSGDTVVVGAPLEDSDATGVNGNQDTTNIDSIDSGAACVFVRQGGTWTQQAYLKASNQLGSIQFGFSVAVSGDTVVVGAPEEYSNATGVNGDQDNVDAWSSGAAYVFVRQGGTWTQQAYLKASNTEAGDTFGTAVAISGDTVVVGAPFESSNATGVNNDQQNNDQTDSGAAYVFVRQGGTWTQQAYLKASNTEAGDFFGARVAISGDTAVVGAFLEDSNANVIDGDQDNNDAEDSGAAYVFVRQGGTWTQQAYLKASNAEQGDNFGISVAISGETVVVGADGEDSNAIGVNGNPNNNTATNSGAAYVFVRQGGIWSQQAYLKASNTGAFDNFGNSIAISADTVVVGASREDSNANVIDGNQANNDAENSGAAYVFVRQGGIWTQQAYLKASNAEEGDNFGFSVAISGDTVVVGAIGEDSNATGVNGSQNNNSATDSGAAYLFQAGKVLSSLGRSGATVLGGTDVALGRVSGGAISPTGETLIGASLIGSGASRGRNRALLSTIGGPLGIAFQSGSGAAGFADLPSGATIASVGDPVHNRTASVGLFQAIARGRGVNSSNNLLLLRDNGAFLSPLLRTGAPVTELAGASLRQFREVLQREGAGDEIALNYTLQRGSGVHAGNDTGLLLMNHAGSLAAATARAGAEAFDGGGLFGRFGSAAILGGNRVAFLAKFIPGGGRPLDALFFTGAANERTDLLQGELAGDTTNGERFRVLMGVTRRDDAALLRSTLTGNVTENEGVWDQGGNLMVRKGQDIGGGITIARILRVWGTNADQVVAQVLLRGPGVNARNNQGLILRQNDDDFLMLLRTGQVAPGIGVNSVTVGAIQAVDVDPINGHYAVLGSLRGAPASANQALWSGRSTLGNDTTLRELRLPRLQLQKGELYTTEVTARDTIRGIGLRPTVERTGVGERGGPALWGGGGGGGPPLGTTDQRSGRDFGDRHRRSQSAGVSAPDAVRCSQIAPMAVRSR